MPETLPSYSRASDALEGVYVTVDGGRITRIEGEPTDPRSAGRVTEPTRLSAAQPSHPERLTRPLRRAGSGWVEASWDEALDDIAERLSATRSAHGDRAIGIYAGTPLAAHHEGAVRAAALAVALGTPNLFSPLALHGAAKLMAAEKVLGAPVPLQADVGRAHYTVLLGADQAEGGWGPLQAGSIHTQALTYFKHRRKQNKLITVDARRPRLCQDSDEHVQLRPGTEVYFLLGLAHAILHRKWVDQQYLDDYCDNIERLRGWLAPWTPARCAEICDIDPGQLAGVALKFARSAMSVVAITRAVTEGPHATVACWAWLVVHALTANLLRPGGLYEAKGLIDLQPILATFPSARAPRTRVSGYPALLLQAPATALPEEILEPGEGQVRALIALGDPISDLPAPPRTRAALESLELLVALDHLPSPTTSLAHWVLPTKHFWERRDLHLLDHALLPTRFMQATQAVLQAPGEARSESDALLALAERLRFGLPRGEHWGAHLRLAARLLATAGPDTLVERVLDWARLPTRAELEVMPAGLDLGELDRATWRPTTESERLDLAPEELGPILAALEAPAADPDYPLGLLTALNAPAGGGRLRGEEPGVGLHPDHGFAEGQRVVVETRSGRAEGPARLDPALRRDAVLVPWGFAVDAASLVGPGPVDPLTGTPVRNGVPCRLRSA
ncbi:MAG: molybdopterin-dependent oxidoreductase [Alphaproteobacteria bacterium]|nr:molybdopterin-dependent oxidoreductase [Alphaproteobacteria bacterium]